MKTKLCRSFGGWVLASQLLFYCFGAEAATDFALLLQEHLLGGNSYVRIEDSSAFDLRRNFTLEARIYWDGGLRFRVIVSKSVADMSSQARTGYHLGIYDGKICLAIQTQNQFRAGCSGLPIVPEQWFHVAASYDARIIRTYVDGIYAGGYDFGSEADAIADADLAQSTPFLIGREFENASYSRPFDGAVDEVRVWRAVISESTLREYHKRPISVEHPKLEALVAYWPMNEGSGAITGDASEKGHEGKLVNQPRWVPIN
jgi:hypothetical protein